MYNIISTIRGYAPKCEQEERDRSQMLTFMEASEGWLTRDNTMAHVTASAWIVDPDRTMALMIYHNIYDSWAWTGGHADGENDLLAVAMREAREETGVDARAVSEAPISIECLCVNGHIKRGSFVSPHIHMNATYLLEADPAAAARIKPDENSGVMWIPFDRLKEYVSEAVMLPIYEKLTARALQMR